MFKEQVVKIEPLQNDWQEQVREMAETITQLAVDKEIRGRKRREMVGNGKRSVSQVISSSFFSWNHVEGVGF